MGVTVLYDTNNRVESYQTVILVILPFGLANVSIRTIESTLKTFITHVIHVLITFNSLICTLNCIKTIGYNYF